MCTVKEIEISSLLLFNNIFYLDDLATDVYLNPPEIFIYLLTLACLIAAGLGARCVC